MNKLDSMPDLKVNNKKDPQKSIALEWSVKCFLLEGLNLFHGTNLTLMSDVNQAK